MKLGVREKNEKGERKKEENYILKGGKGLKYASFWAINLFVGEKTYSQKMIKMHNIYPCIIL